jgi:threonine synthase
MRLLARTEGLFTETAGGVTISALEKLVRTGSISPEQEVVALITGIGLKTIDALGPLEAGHRIRPDVDEVESVLGGRL